MKLKKKTLILLVRDGLKEMGYTEVEDSITGAQGLFIKIIKNEYFLCLGLTISNFYESRFTATFYLSKTTRWGATWDDIPDDSYVRAASLLTEEQRIRLLDQELNANSKTDGWWLANDNKEIHNFIESVQNAEKRIINDNRLFQSIDRSIEINNLVGYVVEVFKIVKSGVDNTFKYRFLPTNNIDDIPMEWFKAAETALTKMGGILNKYTVIDLAADAWRQKTIREK